MFEDLDLFLNGICAYWEKKVTNTLEKVRGNFIGKHKTVRLLLLCPYVTYNCLEMLEKVRPIKEYG